MKSDQISNEKSEAKSIKVFSAAQVLPDHDPYFKETTEIHSNLGPSSITRNIIQDEAGNYWFATWEGILEYDGKTFTNYTNKNRLRRWHVFSILEDKNGHLWFGTVGAGIYLNSQPHGKDTFINYTKKDGLASDAVTCLAQDSKGNIWIGTTGGISLYQAPQNKQQGKNTKFKNLTVADGMTNNDVNAIIEDRNGRIWIGTRGEACYYENGKFNPLLKSDGSPFINVRSIIEDQSGAIWLGGNDGLWRFNPSIKNNGSNEGRFTHYSSRFVGYIYEDKQGHIWTSSVGTHPSAWELTRYDRLTSPIEGFEPVKLWTQKGQLFGILEDRNGAIWFGHERGVCRLPMDDKHAADVNNLECFAN